MNLFKFLRAITGKADAEPPAAPKATEAWVDERYVAQRAELMNDAERGPVARQAEAQAMADDLTALSDRVTSYGVGTNPFDPTFTNQRETPYPHMRDSGGNRIPPKKTR